MSNLHALQAEANKHTAKGFDLVGNNTRPWKDEKGLQTFTENNVLPRAINFVDGTAAAPTNADDDVYVLIGSGVVDVSWGTSTFGDWTRAANTTFTPITPVKGMLCYDDTANKWKEFDGSVWGDFGGGTLLHSGLTLDDGTNPHGTTKADVGLSNVPNTDFTTAVGLNTAKVSADGSINTHSDVDTTTSTPSIGEALIWDGSNWVPDTASGDNIYTADGTLTGARTVTMGGFTLNFGGGLTVENDGTAWNGSGSTGISSTSFGEQNLRSATGDDNTAFGYRSQRDMIGGTKNTSSGNQSMMSATTATNNVALGYSAMQLGDGYNYCIAIGEQALRDVTTGASYNIGIGSIALENLTSGDYNIGLGYRTAQGLTTGIENVFLGNLAAYRTYNGSNSVFIGNRAGSWETASNSFFLDTLVRGSLANQKSQSLLYGTFNATAANQTLAINASVGIGVASGSAKLHVKGNGSTSGTTALLVQNSLGTDLLEVKDDGTILGNLPNIYGADGTLTGARTVTMGGNQLTFNGATVNMYSNNTTALSLDSASGSIINYKSAGVSKFAAGYWTTGTWGIENATGVLFAVNAAGNVSFGANPNSNQWNFQSPSAGEKTMAIGAAGGVKVRLTAPVAKIDMDSLSYNNTAQIWGDDSYMRLKTSNIDRILISRTANEIGMGTTPVTGTALTLKGNGSTSGTTALLVENSSGTDIFVCRDDSAIGMYGATPVVQATTAIAPAIQTPGVGTSVKTDELYDGYTIQQVVKALRNLGILA